MTEVPIRVTWTFRQDKQRAWRKKRWLRRRLAALTKREGKTERKGVDGPRPLYPRDSLIRLEQRAPDEASRRAERLLSDMGRSATRVVDGRERAQEVLTALRRDPDVEPDSVGAILEVSFSDQGPSPATGADRMPQPYLEGRDKGGVNVPRDPSTLRGDRMELAVVEMGWCPHSDLSANIDDLELPQVPVSTVDAPGKLQVRHGNQVLGVLCAQRNDFGIDGLVDRSAKVWVAKYGDDGTASKPSDTHVFLAILASILELPTGSVLVIAADARKPCYSNRLPLEAFRPARFLFHLAALFGIHVVLAVGNGGGVPIDPFCRGELAPSPALVVGGAVPGGGEPEWMSNLGSRVDLHSWGSGVSTCGDEGYTPDFGGTSAATAVVAAVAASVLNHVREAMDENPAYRMPTPEELKRLLVTTGYGWIPFLGPRPDLGAAVAMLRQVDYNNDDLPPMAPDC